MSPGSRAAAPKPMWRKRDPARPRTVALLDLDPELGAELSPERAAAARQALRARVVGLARGEWAGATVASISHTNVGLLVIEGVLAREVALEDTVSTELLGAGDLIRPWIDGDPSELLQQHVRWQVLSDVRLAVLGREVVGALACFPEVNAVLIDRLGARARRLATSQAISHLNSVERRLLALFWHLAERWGRVSSEGIVVPMTLSHRLLAELIGARRPTVSIALAELARDGKLVRRADATWLLLGEPVGAPEGEARRVVLHRRRLLRQQNPRAAEGGA